MAVVEPLMSSDRGFDPLAYAQQMEGFGFSRLQAAGLAEARRLLEERLATKHDIGAMRLASGADSERLRLAVDANVEKFRSLTHADFAQVQAELGAATQRLERKITATRTAMVKWGFAFFVIQILVILCGFLAISRFPIH